MSQPKVSVIMPTHRPELTAQAIAMFSRQTYPNKEMVIMHETAGKEESAGNIVHIYPYEKRKYSIGEKRNICNEFAKGQIIMHCDSDDHYHPQWIEKSVEALITREADLTGLDSLYFFDKANDKAFQYSYSGGQPYAVGASMCYWREVWKRNNFQHISEGEDTIFCGNAGKVRPHNFIGGMIAMLHGNNTASHKAIKSFWNADVDVVKKILATFD